MRTTKSKEIVVKGDELGEYSDIKELRKKAIDYYKINIQGTTIKRDDIGDVRFSGKGLNEFKNHTSDQNKLKVIPYLKDIILKGQIGKEELPKHQRKDDIKSFIPIINKIKIDNIQKEVEVLIAKDKYGNLFYDCFVDYKRKVRSATSDKQGFTTNSNNTITSKIEKVNSININGKNRKMSVLIGEDINGNRFYNLNQDIKKDSEFLPQSNEGSSKSHNNIITSKIEKVNSININGKNKNVEILLKKEDSGKWHYCLYINKKRGNAEPSEKDGGKPSNQIINNISQKVNSFNTEIEEYELNLFFIDNEEQNNNNIKENSMNNEIKYYKKIFMKDGIVNYKDIGQKVLLVQKPTIDNALKTFISCPVIVTHRSNEKVGEVIDAYWDSSKGAYICVFSVISTEAQELLA